MIVLVSHDHIEVTTETIMDWLNHFGASVKRVNGADFLKGVNFSITVTNHTDVKLKVDNFEEKDSVYWYRRWLDKWYIGSFYPLDSKFYRPTASEFAESEFAGLTSAIFYSLRDRIWDFKPPTLTPNPIKTKQLSAARSVGFEIPLTILTDNKMDLLAFGKKNRITSWIVKPISDGTIISDHENTYITYTSKVNDIDALPEKFFPTLFQEFISKKIEVRVFYYEQKCYSMAIFSASDSQTNVDFRRLNYEKPNRNVPYNLPKHIEQKIRELMEKLSLTSGSLDLILSEDYRYVFLEVNPVGQFGMVSFPCNYQLEKIVSTNLLKQKKSIDEQNLKL